MDFGRSEAVKENIFKFVGDLKAHDVLAMLFQCMNFYELKIILNN